MNLQRAVPWLSVIVPTYNGGAYLETALDSVRAEQDSGIEVIAVDDGSTDNTLEILERYSADLPLTIVTRPHRGNWVSSTNHGLSLARGEHALILHQDDMWVKNRTTTLKEVLDRDGSVSMILHPVWFIDRSGARIGQWRCPLPSGPLMDPRLLVERLLIQNFVAMPAPLFSRRAALSVGGLDEQLWYAADWDLWLKLASSGSTVHVPLPLAAFRIYPESQTVQGTSRPGELRRQLDVVLNRHLTGTSFDRPGLRRAARLSAGVNAALAAHHHGHRSEWGRIFLQFLALGPHGWFRYVRDSRIVERVAARIRIGLGQLSTSSP